MQQTSHGGLKIMVIALGFVLIGGAIFVFAAIAGKMKGGEEALACANNKTITIRNKGDVESFDHKGKYLRIHLKDSAKRRYSVVVIDPCAGETLSRITIQAK